jgi:cold shock CspA family protein
MSSTSTSETIYQGRVKWFNNKAGYGFITVIDGVDASDKIGTDIFAHHSAICVNDEQYKYLVQGEYVEFTLSSVDTSADYKYQSNSIKGLKGGKLLCETRNEARSAMPPRTRPIQHKNSKQSTRPHGAGPRDEQDDNQEQGSWTQSTKKASKLTRQNSTRPLDA